MVNQKVMVSGNFNLEELLKALKKKTGKKAEILKVNEKGDMVEKEDDEPEIVQEDNEEDEIITENHEEQKKTDKPQTSTTEVEIHMAFLCEKFEVDVGKVISKFEGVKTCAVDIENQKVIITGDFDKEKLLNKLKKKMRKRINKMEQKKKDKEPIKKDEKVEMDRDIYINPSSADEKEMSRYMMFSDENPNACSIS
ncbi:PREDICTED: heavy metal-associated isoprenylated plant protein 22-like [Camelina sativa]|uniref:Heavy metal-associated isoprenylated plant protein 22-like n=1 Tax=Camelina sativa TaxID=90675 RepID=A0ABM1QLT3_CAMSA|nr:PREDICTED: heavy metal-associated isoprenylated plant protein 22-like [Camelina sativa]